MRLAGVERIVYVSGSGVYGEKPGTSFDEEFGPNLPISTYGASKLACEGLLSAYGHMFGIRSRILRLANVVGPKQTHGVTYDFIRKLRENHESLNVLGDGRQIKSYLEVSDVIDALLLMMGTLNEGECCEIFNVSSDTRLTVQEIADMAVSAFVLREKLSKRPEINFQDNSRGWKADVPDVELDSSKIRSIGWTGKYSSKESVSKALHHVLDETSQ
jgi:UDP-glucose 4-epimerase